MGKEGDDVSRFFQNVVGESIENEWLKITIPDKFSYFLNFVVNTRDRCMDTRFGAGLRDMFTVINSETKEFISIIPPDLRGAAAVGFGSALIVDVGFILPTVLGIESPLSSQLTMMGVVGVGNVISTFWQKYKLI